MRKRAENFWIQNKANNAYDHNAKLSWQEKI